MENWHKSIKGYNYQYYHETLLNYGANRWGLNKSASIGKTSELIRLCDPKKYEEWVEYYFNHALQNKKNGCKITREFIEELGNTLYIKLTEVVSKELEEISQEECIDYVYNLVINRTYEGFQTEIKTVYGQLEKIIGCQINPAPDEWDRRFCVDFYIEVKPNLNIGIQIKPVTGKTLNDFQWANMHIDSHQKFTKTYQGKVFFVLSTKQGDKKAITNPEVIDEIKAEIIRLSGL